MTLLWKSSFNFAQVLADQAIWAVCGRAAAVVDMSSVPKQTVAVEVMPLVGGHLRLPKVRVSKYVEGAAAAAAAAAAGRSSVSSAGKTVRDRVTDSTDSKSRQFSDSADTTSLRT